MRNFDLSPLFRYGIGFDRMSQLLDSAMRGEDNNITYPPYNIEKLSEGSYRITMAVAGFGENDLQITVKNSSLIVSGKIEQPLQEDRKFLHRGIAARAFERRFELADHVKVSSASLDNGLLHIDLAQEIPESAKPRHIPIMVGDGVGKVIEASKEAA